MKLKSQMGLSLCMASQGVHQGRPKPQFQFPKHMTMTLVSNGGLFPANREGGGTEGFNHPRIRWSFGK
ncbi:hypothetical protein C5167_013410 [Papaver somniferum]|uniref:Uncharacterized protein n=1 Tax=Papaver somniferum TaxID=3469 RepID=A0A4Y7J174_PAPSO|nr:hypothetical protein C5167_013410 [Papaver somniferum]